MSRIDESYREALKIYEDFKANRQVVTSEEDVKLHVINDLLIHALGWEKADIGTERHNANGFSDYLVSIGERPAFVLEVKRIGRISVDVTDKKKLKELNLSGPSLKKSLPGIQQATGYAYSDAAPFSILTDGDCWILSQTFVAGKKTEECSAFVFPSYEAVLEDYNIFFSILSKKSVYNHDYKIHFNNLNSSSLEFDKTLYTPYEEADVSLSQKTNLATDLDRVFDVYFDRLRGDDDQDLLIECFVETRESRVADFSLEKMTTKILNNISTDAEIDTHLEKFVASLVSVNEGQTVFIVGPTGAGKTTFLDRFFRKTLSEKIRRQCIEVRVNCLDVSKEETSSLKSIIEDLIDKFEDRMFQDKAPTYKELQGLYFSEYQKKMKGVWSHLYERDKQQFKIDFGNHISSLIDGDREGYLKRLVKDIVDNRKKLPVIIIDNLDDHDFNRQKEVFQMTQVLLRYANHALVIFPITDKTAWIFSKSDVFSIYNSKSFFLPTPSPREVLRKRVEYLRGKADLDISDIRKKEYFTSKNIRISIKDLSSFSNVLESVFVNDDFSSRVVGELSNFNIRRCLNLCRRVITSSTFNIDSIIKSYLAHDPIYHTRDKFVESLMKGDYDFMKKSDHHEIFPLFDIDLRVRQSPLINLRILYFLEKVREASKNIDEAHVDIQHVIDFFDVVGFSESAVLLAIKKLIQARLIEFYDMSSSEFARSQRVAISFSGIAHLNFATSDRTFFYQMALVSDYTELQYVEEIRKIYSTENDEFAKRLQISQLFSKYLIASDKKEGSLRDEDDSRFSQKELIDKINEMGNIGAGTAYKGTIGFSLTDVQATVEWFSVKENYGFAQVKDYDFNVFIHRSVLKESPFDNLYDGDNILCDIGKSEKGYAVTRIKEINLPEDINIKECKIIKIIKDKHYGFVQVEGSETSAFFHYSAFDHLNHLDIIEGLEFQAELRQGREGQGLQVRRVLV